MGFLLFHLFSWWGFLLQGVAIIHFIRRRPDTFWLWIILIGRLAGRAGLTSSAKWRRTPDC